MALRDSVAAAGRLKDRGVTWSIRPFPGPPGYGRFFFADRYSPNLRRILSDRAIRGEPADARRIVHRGTPPSHRVTPHSINGMLSLDVAVEVGTDHERVALEQVVDEAGISFRFAR